jgi:hypothetical protein
LAARGEGNGKAPEKPARRLAEKTMWPSGKAARIDELGRAEDDYRRGQAERFVRWNRIVEGLPEMPPAGIEPAHAV